MARYIIKRIFLMIFVMFGVSLFVFAISRASGDPVVMMLGDTYTKEQYDAMYIQMGMDKPYVVQYLSYIWDVLHLDFGISYFTKVPVIDEIANRLPLSFTIAVCTLVISVPVGVIIGIVSAVKQNTVIDYALTSFTLVLLAIPNFWLALLLILLFGLHLNILPASYNSTWQSLILPCITLGMHPITQNARLTRTRMLEVIRQDYIRTARSKGLSERKVIWSHALKNAIVPVLTQVGANMSVMVGSSAVVEGIFNIPGLGSYIISAIGMRDFPALQGAVLVFSLYVSCVNLVVDILYGFVDPRIRAKYMSYKKKKVIKKTSAIEGVQA